MTTLETKAGTTDADDQADNQAVTTPAAVEQSTETAALITEQQVLFASAAALAPAPALTPTPAEHHRAGHGLATAVRAMFARPEKKTRARKHYPQRFGYLENSLMSREMDRL